MLNIRKDRFLLGLLIIGLSLTNLNAQNGLFTHEDFFKLILANHPVARQANLLGAEAEAYVLKARGGFDPKLKGDLDQKTFDGKNYFNIGEVGLSIPTWYGLEVKSGFSWNDGIFLNPERNLPAGGQAEIGLSANLLQGLMIDERRATLKQAEIMRDLNAAERLSILNELLLEANDYYWQWVLSSQLVRINEEALRLAVQRFDGVMISYEQGYDAAVDTLQSSILVQSRRVALQEAQLDLRNIILAISNFLWTTDDVPLELDSGLTAPLLASLAFNAITQEEVTTLSQQIRERHPDLMQYTFQLEQLEIDQQLKREMLKPQLTVSYSLLGDRFNFNSYQQEDDSALQNIFGQNYKWGVSMRFPLFLRK